MKYATEPHQTHSEEIGKRILDYDAKHSDYRGVRFYAYLTTIRKELVKITVAVRNKSKHTRLLKQVAVHGVYSDNCLVRDMDYSFMGNFRVGWYDEGLKYPNDLRPYYNDGIWYSADYKYYDPWAYIVNPRFALTLKEFRYSAVDIQNPPCIISYLRTYIKYPQAEYLVKAGLGKYVGSTMILKKIGSDKGFRKWLMANREELTRRHYYVDVVLRGYKTGKPLKALQAYREAEDKFEEQRLLEAHPRSFYGKSARAVFRLHLRAKHQRKHL